MIVTPNFHMNGNCKQAIELYKRAFGAKVQALLLESEADPVDCTARHTERVYHAVLMLGTQRILMTDDTEDHPPKGNTLSLVLTYDTKEEVMAAFEAVCEGAQVIAPPHDTPYSSCMVSLVDRFGVRWELMTEQTER